MMINFGFNNNNIRFIYIFKSKKIFNLSKMIISKEYKVECRL
jgi:hypothetical protein